MDGVLESRFLFIKAAKAVKKEKYTMTATETDVEAVVMTVAITVVVGTVQET